MKLTMKFFLIISLFCSVALAGDMDGGTLAGDMDGGTLSGDMDGGTIKCTKCIVKNEKDDDSVLNFIEEFLKNLLG